MYRHARGRILAMVLAALAASGCWGFRLREAGRPWAGLAAGTMQFLGALAIAASPATLASPGGDDDDFALALGLGTGILVGGVLLEETADADRAARRAGEDGLAVRWRRATDVPARAAGRDRAGGCRVTALWEGNRLALAVRF